LARWVSLAQPDAGLVNTYTATLNAPAATVPPSPETATEKPSSSSMAPWEAVSLAAWVSLAQPDAGLVNTYTAP
jgi:hypothetical protein